ncbi:MULTISPECIES: NusG domain II-containing protein [unclassified Thioalkalivibrio]|uniref:NusG domain II-containing protein n=1 Tax=unclassified Thioalkalivibrio TaxID=2621013 RepID=UPI0003709D40|nr:MULTISPECIES: NusG domain II-containing protein [unclassified Thioalkalivibrio]
MNAGRLRWGDALIGSLAAGIVVAAFVLAYTPAGDARVLVISQAGVAPQHEPLDRARVLEVRGPAGITRIEIEPGRARCADSPGRQDICESSGWLQAHGDVAVSLPNRLTLQVLGTDPGFDSMHY